MSKRYAGIRHIKDSSFEISYYPYPGARRKQYRIKAKSLKEASFIRAERMKNCFSRVSEGASFDELKAPLMESLQADRKSQKTITEFIYIFDTFFNQFLPKYFPHIDSINQLTIPVITKYKWYIVVEKGRQYGWNAELSKFKAIVKRLTRGGFCERRIYYEVLSEFKREKSREMPYKELSKTEKLQLLKYVKEKRPDYFGVTYFLIRLGWRIGQVLAVKRANIKWQGLIPIEIKVDAEDTKTKVPYRLSSIDIELAKVIKMYAFDRRKTQWLFPNKRNNKINYRRYGEYLGRITSELFNKRVMPHDFRRMFATENKRKGFSDKDIMAITGHKDVGVFTRHYVFTTSEGVKSILQETKLGI